MLHRILLISSSGMILFVKEYYTTHSTKSIKATQLAGILCAMNTFVQQRTDMNVQYIQCQQQSVALYVDSNTKIICVLIHDTTDTPYLGELLCQSIIHTFCYTYNKLLINNALHTIQQDRFHEFNSKIYSITRNTVKPILIELEQTRGILLVLLTNTTGDSLTTAGILSNGSILQQTNENGKLNIGMMSFAQMQSYQPNNNHQHNSVVKHSDIDKLSILANHQALINSAVDIMNKQNDILHTITLRSRRSTMYLQRIEKSSLIVLMKNSVDPATCMTAIDKAAATLQKILQIAANLKT